MKERHAAAWASTQGLAVRAGSNGAISLKDVAQDEHYAPEMMGVPSL